jgi:hypothetical protein
MLRRDFEIKSEGFDFSSARRALNEAVRRSISAGVSLSASGEFGKITRHCKVRA